jgi:hypothetical protein
LSLKDATSSRSGKSSVEDMAMMFIGVVIEPNKEHKFDSKIFLERVSEENQLQWVTYQKTFSHDHLINDEKFRDLTYSG